MMNYRTQKPEERPREQVKTQSFTNYDTMGKGNWQIYHEFPPNGKHTAWSICMISFHLQVTICPWHQAMQREEETTDNEGSSMQRGET